MLGCWQCVFLLLTQPRVTAARQLPYMASAFAQSTLGAGIEIGRGRWESFVMPLALICTPPCSLLPSVPGYSTISLRPVLQQGLGFFSEGLCCLLCPVAEQRRCVPHPRGGSGTLRPRLLALGTAGGISVGCPQRVCVQWDALYLPMFSSNKELLVHISESPCEFRGGLLAVRCPACPKH